MTNESHILTADGPVLSTLEQDGSRRWLYPKLARGHFWSGRRVVAYALLALYAALPFIPVRGKPAVLLDVVHRRFTLFGVTFLPTDTVLLALLLVSAILLIFLMTALLGRVWCGWACPQTVYMEFVFRPIERLFTGRRGVGGKPRERVARWRYAAMYAAYLVVCLHLSQTFLAYFVGAAELNRWITHESPIGHLAPFLVVACVTGAMMFNFAWFREQTCLIACPYGRLQSVLLDRSSLIISYDTKRGEPRGKVQRPPATHSLTVLPDAKGDCVDCGNCVTVCPTGIDIRNGLQFECIGCAQCIDACNAVMSKIGRPLGLIRYGSQAGMAGEPTRLLRPRVIIYPAILAGVLGLLFTLLATRSPTDVTLLRSPGAPFIVTPAGQVQNVMRLKLTNRTERAQDLTVSILGRDDVTVITEQQPIHLEAGATTVEALQILAPPADFPFGWLDVTVRVGGVGPDASLKIERPCRLLGPSAGLSQGGGHGR